MTLYPLVPVLIILVLFEGHRGVGKVEVVLDVTYMNWITHRLVCKGGVSKGDN